MIKTLEIMVWTEVIIANLATLGVAALGVAVTILFYKTDKRHARDTKTINKLANQVKAYYELEQIYIAEMSNLSSTAAKTIQQKNRKLVLENNPDIQINGRWMSSQEADRYIRP